MKIFLTLSLLLICAAVANAQADTALCVTFHTGTFAYRNDSSEIIRITRTSNRQEERNEKSGRITKSKIKWLDACTYEIKQVWSDSRKLRKQNGSVTKVVITATTKESYQFSCACGNDEINSKKITGTVVRIFY